MFVSKSIKKEMNVFGSWFCSFVCPFTIAIFRGGEGGEENVKRRGPSCFLSVLPLHLQQGKYWNITMKKWRIISVMSGSLTSQARFHRVFVTVPFLALSKLRRLKYYDKKYKTNKHRHWDLYFQFVQSQLDNSPCSILSLETSSNDSFIFRQAGNGSTSVAGATCLASLLLQLDFRESPGSLFLLTSHYRGLHSNKYVWAVHTSASTASAAPHGSPLESELLWRLSQWQRA